MLNKKNERELAYVVKVDNITPMNADRLECAHVNGWHCVVGKGEFKVGDLAVYFEIDSQLPNTFPFNTMEFLKSKNFKIKSQKIRGEVSQGLLMPLSAWTNSEGMVPVWVAIINLYAATGNDILASESRFLTKELAVTYAIAEDNQRKAASADKYKKMTQRHPKIFKHKWAQWLLHFAWGKKLLFFFFGKKKDKKTDWPMWVKKTDEERCQNMPWLFPANTTKWIATEKIDGTSTTFTMKNDRKKRMIVCSRNVVYDTPKKESRNFYKDSDGNVYLEMASKYNMEQVLKNAINYWEDSLTPVEYVTIQGETYGGTIQKRNYGEEHRLAIFNVIFGFKNGEVRRLNPIDMYGFLLEVQPKDGATLTGVPIVSKEFTLPDTCEELLAIAAGDSAIDGGMREGLVFRSEDGQQSFKAVSNEFLLKYHG